MEDQQQSITTTILTLKHMELTPQILTLSQPTHLIIKISKNNSSSTSQCSNAFGRKFIFLVQQTDEQSDPLTQGQQYKFNQILSEVSTYHIQCLNYPKIKSVIQISKKEQEPQQLIQHKESRISLPPIQMQNIVEVQQQQKQQETKSSYEQHFDHSNSKSDYAQYQKMLNFQDKHYDELPNRYLKYFKEEFKLWRDFFEPPETPTKCVNVKQKFGSQQHDKKSSSSLQFSQKQSQKEQSVVSRLRSHQEISDINEEQLNHPKTMKKTNSEYCFNSQREVEKTHFSSNSKKRPFYTTTSSPHQRTQQSQAETFLDWACSWTFQQGCDQLVIKKRGDRHLSRQWFTYLHNKFKISEFMHG